MFLDLGVRGTQNHPGSSWGMQCIIQQAAASAAELWIRRTAVRKLDSLNFMDLPGRIRRTALWKLESLHFMDLHGRIRRMALCKVESLHFMDLHGISMDFTWISGL